MHENFKRSGTGMGKTSKEARQCICQEERLVGGRGWSRMEEGE